MRYILLPLSIIIFPLSLHAQVVIQEIMYDLPGTDSGREWVEIVNLGESAADLTGWKFFEANTNHSLSTTTSGQTLTLSPGGIAIIADDPTKFLIDWPAFAGALFGSSFSLSNSGETLVLKDSTPADIDTVLYSSSSGAAGDGNSLHRTPLGSGSDFSADVATPGAGNSGTPPETPVEEPQPEEQTESEAAPSSSSSVSGPSFPVEPQIFTDGGSNRAVTVGADSTFTGKAWGLQKEPLENARYVWNFGNGIIKEGQKVLAHYDYPGEYVVVLSIASGEFSATDRFIVTALPAAVTISRADQSLVELWNNGGKDIDLSFWYLVSGATRFLIPENTIVLAYKKLIFSSAVTGLSPQNTNEAALLFPNGTPALVLKSSAPAAVSLPPTTVVAFKASPVSTIQKQESKEQIAGVGAADPVSPKTSLYPWLFGLAGIIAVGVGVIFLWKEDEEAIRIIE